MRRADNRSANRLIATAAALALMLGATGAHAQASAEPAPTSGATSTPGAGHVRLLVTSASRTYRIRVTNVEVVESTDEPGGLVTACQNGHCHMRAPRADDAVTSSHHDPYGTPVECSTPCTLYVDPGYVQVTRSAVDLAHYAANEEFSVLTDSQLTLRDHNLVVALTGAALIGAAVIAGVTLLAVNATGGFTNDGNQQQVIGWSVVGAGVGLAAIGLAVWIFGQKGSQQTALSAGMISTRGGATPTAAMAW